MQNKRDKQQKPNKKRSATGPPETRQQQNTHKATTANKTRKKRKRKTKKRSGTIKVQKGKEKKLKCINFDALFVKPKFLLNLT